MPDTASQYTAKPRLAYAKLVATPTETSWAQAYNAGNLFACLSLTKTRQSIHPEEEETELATQSASLHAVGKEIFNILESEFFTLTEKNIHTIKAAIMASIKHVPHDTSVNLCMAVFKEDTLYLFIAGAGKVLLKRDKQIGILLEKDNATAGPDNDISSASGYLKNNDTIVLETNQFTKDISDETLGSALELSLPSDIAEALSPQIHETDDGDQAAIIIAYHGFAHEAEPDQTLEQAQKQYVVESETGPTHTAETDLRHKRLLPRIALPSLRLPRINHTKKLFLSVAVVIAVLLGASIFMAQDKQKKGKQQQLFVSIYNPAKKIYDEGKSIQSLNSTLSQEDFLKAEKALKEGIAKFAADSPEKKQLEELLAKVQSELQTKTVTNSTKVKEVKSDENSLLAVANTEKDGLAFGQNDSTIYFVTEKAVMTVNKSSGKQTEALKNDKDWQSPKAIVPYQGNLYLLDQKTGILKYVASGGGFEKSSYFKQAPDLSKAVGIAVDGSVWILFQDGTVFKYTKGVSDGFKISGLTTKLSNPTKIFTDLNTTNLYILDQGNSRIVKISKEGAFQSHYQNSILQKAKDFEVKESEKKIYVLSEGKVYEMDL